MQVSPALRLALAALSIGAGAIHLVMVPAHFQEGMLDGLGFAIAAWAQIGIGIALVAWPRRALLAPAVIINAGVLVLWIVSRTVGLPAGAHQGIVEPVGEVDGIAALFAAGVIVVGLVGMAKPLLGAGMKDQALMVASVVPALVLVATTMVLTSDEIGNHLHETGAGDGHAHSEADAALATIASERCDLGFNPAAYWQETAITGTDVIAGGAGIDGGHDHGSTSFGSLDDMPFDGRGSPDLDRVLTRMDSFGEIGAATVIAELADVDDEVYDAWLRMLHLYQHDNGHGDSADAHGAGAHLGPQAWVAMTDQAQCDQLADELELAYDTAMTYRTAEDAIEGGYRLVTPYVPGIAAHYMNFSYVDTTFEIDKPEMLLFDGNGPDATIVGLSYYVLHDAESQPTQGFTGFNDDYHRHVGLCMANGVVIGDTDTTAEECEAMGGRKGDGRSGWMSHAWVVPGCESPWGVFSASNPMLDVPLGQASSTDGGGCAGSSVQGRYDLTPGSLENTPVTVSGQAEVETAAP